jgi:hypothetical protein
MQYVHKLLAPEHLAGHRRQRHSATCRQQQWDWDWETSGKGTPSCETTVVSCIYTQAQDGQHSLCRHKTCNTSSKQNGRKRWTHNWSRCECNVQHTCMGQYGYLQQDSAVLEWLWHRSVSETYNYSSLQRKVDQLPWMNETDGQWKIKLSTSKHHFCHNRFHIDNRKFGAFSARTSDPGASIGRVRSRTI